MPRPKKEEEERRSFEKSEKTKKWRKVEKGKKEAEAYTEAKERGRRKETL